MRYLCIILVFLSVDVARAQPVLTYAANGVDTNTILRMHKGNFIAPSGMMGSNLVWDFSGMSDSGLATPYSFVSCAASGANCNSYPGANLVMPKGSGNFDYYTSDSTHLVLRGLEGSGRKVLLGNTADVQRYPFGMGDAYRDTLSGSYTSQGIKDSVFGFVEVKSNASGTLILPGKTYQNALLVERYDDFTDINMGTQRMTEWTSKATLSWYVAGERTPVLIQQVITDLANGGPAKRAAYFKRDSAIAAGISGSLKNAPLSVIIFPNPAAGSLLVSFKTESGTGINFQLCDMAGREIVVKAADPAVITAGQLTIDIHDLAAGCYVLHAQSGNQRLAQKVLITSR